MKFKKAARVFLLLGLLFSLTIPASAVTYDATFNYFVLNTESGEYEFHHSSYYRASGSGPNDTFIISVGLYPYYASSELINDGYTSTYEYQRSDSHSILGGDTSKYNVVYKFTPVTFAVTYELDGMSYQTQTCYYGDTVSVLSAPVKTGYTFSGWSSSDITLTGESFSMPAKNITMQGTYLVHSNTVMYEYAGTVPKNAPALPPASTYNYGTAVNITSAPTALGYTFSGWISSNATLTSGSFTMPDGPVTLVGSWSPRTDTAYTVEYYQQNMEDDGYTLADTDRCTGTTDTAAIAQVKSYAGFTVTPGSVTSASSTKIAGDGSTTVKLYYDRKDNTVTYAYSGQTDVTPPTLPATESYRYGRTVALVAAPTLPGYDFGGWLTSDAAVTGGSFVMPDAAVTLTGNWTPRADTAYTVEYYQQNMDDGGYTLADTLHGKGITGGHIPHKEFIGFTQTSASVAAEGTAKIKSDGSSFVKLYYDRKVNTVTYTYSGKTDVTPPMLPADGSHRFGQTVMLAPAPTLPGYDFGGWLTAGVTVADDHFTMPDGPVTLVGSWTPRTDTPYTVEYYQQNTDNDDYTLADTFTGKGTTGGGVLHKEFVGFTETPDSVTAEGNAKIKSDGTTLLKLYYDRNIETVTYTYSGETDTTPPEPPEVRSYRYGQMVTPAEASLMPGYDFSGWSSSDVSIQDGSFTMPDGSVTLVGSWTPRTDTAYTVEYYQQNLNDDGYTLANTFTGKGTTGGGVLHKEFVGFTETPDSVTAEGNAKIKSDGTTLLKLYYDRNIETVTYAYSGETDATPPELPCAASYRVGQSVRVADAPTLPGYDFDGWSTSDATIADGSFTMPDAAVVLTGAWATRTDIPYTVEYYWQNAADDDYTLADTFRGKGSVGGSIPHKEFEGFTETPDSVTAEGSTKIKSDGSTLVKLYYDRDRYLVSFAYYGTAPNAAPTLPESTLYRFGTSVTLPAIPSTVSGMSFSGWTADGGKISGNILSVPAQDTQVTGTWKQISDSGDVPEATPVEAVTLEDNGSAYVIGYEDGTFRPDAYLTAKHEALMLSRLGLPVTPLSGGADALGTERFITRREFLCALLDAAGAIAESAADPVAQAAALGWISGYTNGELYPNAYITRAQAVVIINRAFGRVAALDLKTDIIYVDLPQDYWAYDAIMAASNIF